MITGMWSTAGWSAGGWEMMRIACRECRELVEEPALYSEEDEGMPLHCRVIWLIRELRSMKGWLFC